MWKNLFVSISLKRHQQHSKYIIYSEPVITEAITYDQLYPLIAGGSA